MLQPDATLPHCGIARNVLAPILSGGSVVAMPVFEPSLFWKAAQSANATWYYAGPTMHMLILDSYKQAEPKPTISLRFVANAAGPLLHSVAADMRDTFSAAAGRFVSIMPSYGMTECMPISSPPVGFNLEKPGSSGQIVGPKCEIHDDEGNALTVEQVGHIMVSGHPVMRGYSNNPDANKESFCKDGRWFKTGDMGKFDGDGYLYITGRSKDVINRGGEIISPIEVCMHQPKQASQAKRAPSHPLPPHPSPPTGGGIPSNTSVHKGATRIPFTP